MPSSSHITCLLSILALVISAVVAVGCASITDEKAFLEWIGTSTEDFKATFFHFILPIPITLLVLSLLQAFIISSIPGQRTFSDDTKEKIEKKSTIERILLVPHGGWHNDTICTVEVKTREGVS